MNDTAKNNLLILGLHLLGLILLTKWLGFKGLLLSICIFVLEFFAFGLVGHIKERNAYAPVSDTNARHEQDIDKHNTESDFDEQNYNEKNQKDIEEFLGKYDLSTVEGILSIPVPTQKQTQMPYSVVSTPEQILQKKATEYKKQGNFEIAIACLYKSNQFMKVSWYQYQIKDYMRLVEFLYLARRFNEARAEREKICQFFGGDEIDILTKLMKSVCKTEGEEEGYYNHVIVPAKDELNDREAYYWLLEHIPDATPKSFAAYRKAKKQNTEKFQELKKLAEHKGRNL